MAEPNISGNLFLSYRRDDSSGYALMIWEQVKAHFGKKRVFMDIDTIQAGEDFRRVIEDRVRTCDVVLVLLGKGWSKIADETGSRRLNNPNDFVRLEVSTALRQDVLVLPVLVGGASMPRPEDLPVDIQALCGRNAWEMRDRSFQRDLKQLISFIEQVIREREKRRRQEALSQRRTEEHAKRTLDELGRIEVGPEIEQDAIAWIERATKRRKQLKVALSVFASFGAASAFYVIGAVEQDVGKSAPWFVLGAVVLSCAVRALQIESNDLFGRDDVYTTVEGAFGRTTGLLASSALLFDAILVGPICAMVAGAYIESEINIIGDHSHLYAHVPVGLLSVLLGIALVSYYWRKQVGGRAQSNRYVQRALFANAALVAALLLWCAGTASVRPAQLPPFPSKTNLYLSIRTLGWLRGTAAPRIGMLTLLIAFGNSILAVTSEESLSQSNDLFKAMRLTPLRGIAIVNLVNGFLFPALVPFFFVMLIPDSTRYLYMDSPLAGLIYFLEGPFVIRLLLAIMFSILGAVILFRIIDWSMSISATAFSSAAEDTRLRWATRTRIIHVLAIVQLAMIVLSRGNTTSLMRAYGLGVGSSFTLQALSLVIFRYKRPSSDRWLVPVNITVGRLHLPIGLGFVSITLLLMTSINLFTRVVATVMCSTFAIAVFVLFRLSSNEPRKLQNE